jgi:hypothetical protein
MSGLVSSRADHGRNGLTAMVIPQTFNQATALSLLFGISGWLLASLLFTPLPGAGPALLAPSLGALIMGTAAVRMRRHILR